MGVVLGVPKQRLGTAGGEASRSEAGTLRSGARATSGELEDLADREAANEERIPQALGLRKWE